VRLISVRASCLVSEPFFYSLFYYLVFLTLMFSCSLPPLPLALPSLSLCVVPRYVLVKAMRICARDGHWGGVEQLLELMLKQGHTPTPAALHFRWVHGGGRGGGFGCGFCLLLLRSLLQSCAWSRLLPLFPAHLLHLSSPTPRRPATCISVVALMRLEQGDRAYRLLDVMRKKGVGARPLTVRTYCMEMARKGVHTPPGLLALSSKTQLRARLSPLNLPLPLPLPLPPPRHSLSHRTLTHASP